MILLLLSCSMLLCGILRLPILHLYNFHRLDHHRHFSAWFLFICSALYLQRLTNPVIWIHTLFGFMWCQKEMVFWPDQKSCLISLKFNGRWQPTKHKPTCLFRCSRREYTPDNLLFFFFFCSFCLPEEVFSTQHDSLKEEKESLTKLQKECTAKRYVWTYN